MKKTNYLALAILALSFGTIKTGSVEQPETDWVDTGAEYAKSGWNHSVGGIGSVILSGRKHLAERELVKCFDIVQTMIDSCSKGSDCDPEQIAKLNPCRKLYKARLQYLEDQHSYFTKQLQFALDKSQNEDTLEPPVPAATIVDRDGDEGPSCPGLDDDVEEDSNGDAVSTTSGSDSSTDPEAAPDAGHDSE